jgi:hypothetical protein
MFNFKKIYSVVVSMNDICKLIDCTRILNIKIKDIGYCGWVDERRPYFIIFKGTKKEYKTLKELMSLVDIQEIER